MAIMLKYVLACLGATQNCAACRSDLRPDPVCYMTSVRSDTRMATAQQYWTTAVLLCTYYAFSLVFIKQHNTAQHEV